MKRVILFLFIFNLGLCCALCYFRNLHKDHKVIEINDEEILKQNNISIENEENDLNILIEESYKIKEQIMEEMKLYYSEIYEVIKKGEFSSKIIKSYKKK